MCAVRYGATSLPVTQPSLRTYFGAFAALQPRGPDSTRFDVVYDRFIFGFHRLSINDLSHKGDQPFYYEDDYETLYLLCNGEIYNYRALATANADIPLHSGSDCEIILGLYRKYGIDQMVRMLDGEFAFVLHRYDKRDGTQTTIVARDYVGVRPLYFGTIGDDYFFSSELKGLTPIPDIVADQFPIGQYRTLSHDAAGRMTKVEHTYHTMTTQIVSPVSSDEVYTTIRTLFTDAVAKRLMADRPLGCLLSGGLDSSLVAATTAKLLATKGKKLTVFTISFPGGTDLPYAQKVAEYIGAEHVVVAITEAQALAAIEHVVQAIESYDTTTVRASTMQYLLAQYISKHSPIKAILVGEMSDEVFGGYLYSHLAPSPEALRADAYRLVAEIHRYDGQRTDRTMACRGLEARLPFADQALVDYVFSLPPELTIPTDGHEKHLLRQAFTGTGLLPDDVLWRKKEAFSDATSSPVRSRYTIIQEYVETIISDTDLAQAASIYPHNTPDTKEKYRYRQLFTKHFSDHYAHVIPHLRMPQRTTETKDPSARTLAVYGKR